MHKIGPTNSDEFREDFPKLSAPALRALANAKIDTLEELAKYTEKDILALHGIGPSAIPKLREALTAKGLTFKPKNSA